MPTSTELRDKLDTLNDELSTTRQKAVDAQLAALSARDESVALKALSTGLVSANLERDLTEKVNAVQEELRKAETQEFAEKVVPALEQLDELIETALKAFDQPIKNLASAIVEREAEISQARVRANTLGHSDTIRLDRPGMQVANYSIRSTNSSTTAALSGMLVPLYSLLKERVLAAELDARRKAGTILSVQ
jgi:hypothetical protein